MFRSLCWHIYSDKNQQHIGVVKARSKCLYQQAKALKAYGAEQTPRKRFPGHFRIWRIGIDAAFGSVRFNCVVVAAISHYHHAGKRKCA
jgi:hypothetical protein